MAGRPVVDKTGLTGSYRVEMLVIDRIERPAEN
jgi:hypothetical protein